MGTIGSLFILFVLMIVGGSIGVIVLSLGGLLGGLIAMKSSSNQKYDALWILGFVTSVCGQTFVALVWVAIILTLIRNATLQGSAWGLPLWILGFFAAISLTASASRATKQEEQGDSEYAATSNFNVQHLAVPIAGLLSVIGFFVFALLPSVMNALLGWLPYID